MSAEREDDTVTKIKLTEDTDARNARMWDRFKMAPDSFAKHVELARWQDHSENAQARWDAWVEGPSGFQNRIASGVPGYAALIAAHAMAVLG